MYPDSNKLLIYPRLKILKNKMQYLKWLMSKMWFLKGFNPIVNSNGREQIAKTTANQENEVELI